ncbi:glycoside hydrolase family 20 zincin-like fold domain-containing protein [Kitasatospora sp. NPDC001660]
MVRRFRSGPRRSFRRGQDAGTDLVPAPSSAVRRPGGDFPLDDATTLTAPPAPADAARWLRTALSAATGLPLGPGGPGTGIELVHDEALAAEAYRIAVGPGHVVVAAWPSAGGG